VDWYEITGEYHSRTFKHDCRLSSLTAEWQRELAALWRLEADVNNGFYLQFFVNWCRESYVYASQALKRIGALKMADLIDPCQGLIDEHFLPDGGSLAKAGQLLPGPILDRHGELIKDPGSVQPEAITTRLDELSSDFVQYPEDIASLGLTYYRPYIEAAGDA
jgi:Domain of unknown function (DUF4375)